MTAIWRCLPCIVFLMISCDPKAAVIDVYTHPLATDAVSLNISDIRKYLDSCDLILEMDNIEDRIDYSGNTETHIMRQYRVCRALRGNIAPGTWITEDYYPEFSSEQDIRKYYNLPPETDLSHKPVVRISSGGRAWLCLRRNFLYPQEGGSLYIARHEEAYAYNYYLHGKAADKLIQSLVTRER